MGARKGRKQEMRVRVSECGGDVARAGMGAELWLTAFQGDALTREGAHPWAQSHLPRCGGAAEGGVLEEWHWGGDGRFHPLSVLRKRAKTPAGEEGRDLVRSPELF